MSWHFLERWVEKANQHSTLIGKFWITFLIVCRMVIVASVGDRVYSDEQSEFKCNTLQPGCTNVCFNDFSPISHLRFWSFQILLVATPSVMYVIYSAHVPKKPKDKQKQLRKKRELEILRRGQRPDAGNAGEDDDSTNINNKNWKSARNMIVRGGYYNDMGSRYRRRRHSNSDSDDTNDKLSKWGKQTPDEGNFQRNVDERYIKAPDQLPKIRATLINYKYESDDDKYFLRNEISGKDFKDGDAWSLPGRQGRYSDRGDVKNNNNNNASTRNKKGSGMWRKPRSNDPRKLNQGEWLDSNGGLKPSKTKPVSEVIPWGPASSDDDYNRKIGRNDRTLIEADMYGKMPMIPNGIDIGKHPMDDDIVIPTAPPPPEYPGNISDRQQWRLLDGGNKMEGKSGKVPLRVKIVRHKKKPTFTRHFHLYLLNVFTRLIFEVVFLVLQIFLFGFAVPELYKCERWPCPNVVDCFISRPMEKTIFLYFMCIYSCICVLLNLFELKYLVWVYIFGRPALKIERDGCRPTSPSNDQFKSTTSYGLDEYDSGDLTTDDFDSTLLTPGAQAEYLKYGPAYMRGQKWRSTAGRYVDYGKSRRQREIERKKKLGLMLDSEEDERDDVEIDIMAEEMQNDDHDIEVNDSGSVGGDDGFA